MTCVRNWLPQPPPNDTCLCCCRRFRSSPEAAVDVLIQEALALPSIDPALPWEITHVWLTSTWSFGQGLRWVPGQGWSSFSKLQP